MQTCQPPKGGGERRTSALDPDPSRDLSAKLCTGKTHPHPVIQTDAVPLANGTDLEPKASCLCGGRGVPFPLNLHNTPWSPRTSGLPWAPLCPAARVELEAAGFRGTGWLYTGPCPAHTVQKGKGLPRSARLNISKCRESWPKPGRHHTQKQRSARERPGTWKPEVRPSIHG